MCPEKPRTFSKNSPIISAGHRDFTNGGWTIETKIFSCKPALNNAPEKTPFCEDLAVAFHAEMKAKGYECRIERYDDYIEDTSTEQLRCETFYSVTCREGPELFRKMMLASEFLYYLENIEFNNESDGTCTLSDPSGREPSKDDINACEELSTWNATIWIEKYIRDNELEKRQKDRLLTAIVKAIDITIESDPSRLWSMNRNGVMVSRAFDILKRIGSEGDGMTVPILMKAIRAKIYEYEAIVALNEIAPYSSELEEARNILRLSVKRYVRGTMDPERAGKLHDLRINYYGAISVIAPGSNEQRKAWRNICEGWDRYPDQPWARGYLDKFREFCGQR
ncbi:MAG: hypothetical protein JXA24_01225 [Proteobacteria bacterium]|nr:hypothetical protein [Pseudomonadota bacterium]